MLRIIAGLYKSRRIAIPKGVEIRPTQDRVRESIFNLLQNVNGMRVLELFAGSGAFGIEAISRGASHVTFVENNPRCIETIKSNLDSLQIPESGYNIIRSNAISIATTLRIDKPFDLVFLDPPYYKDIPKKCLIYIDACDILSPGALVVVERYKTDELPIDLKYLVQEKERMYGDKIITILRKKSQ